MPSVFFVLKKKSYPKKEEIDIKFTISLKELRYRYYAKSTYNIIVEQPPDSPR